MAYDYTWSDFVGNIGVALLVITYAGLQFGKLDAKGFWYSFNNLMVAVLLGINLYYKPNLSSIIIEVFWFAISGYGLYTYWRNHERNNIGSKGKKRRQQKGAITRCSR